MDSCFPINEVICGGARGVDDIGARWAALNDITIKHFPADWSLGKSAGPKRNRDMAIYANHYNGGLILVWDGQSRGSANMLQNAIEFKLTIFQKIIKVK